MSLRIVPLSIRVSDVAIAEDSRFGAAAPFVRAGQVSVVVKLLPLLRKQLHIQSFVLREPAIELVRNAEGKWNFSTLGGMQSGGASGGGFSIDEFRVEDGALAVSELGKQRSIYRNIDIKLKGVAPGQPLDLEMSAALPDEGGSIRMLASGEPQNLAGRLELQDVATAALRKFAGASAVEADGIITGAIRFKLTKAQAAAQTQLTVDRIRIGGQDAGKAVKIEGDQLYNVDTGVLGTSETRLLAGGVPVTISGELDTRASKADLTVRTKGAPVAEILALASAFGAGPVSGSGTLTLDARIRGRLANLSELDFRGGGALRDATLQLPWLTKPLRLASATLALAGQEVRIDGLACSLGSSNLRGGVIARNFAAPSAEFNLDIDRLDVAEMQTMVKSEPAQRGSGRVAHATFRAKGKLGVGELRVNQIVFRQVRSECSFAEGVLALAPLSAQVFGGTQAGSITLDMRQEPAAVAVNTKLDSVDANQLLSATTSLKDAIFGMLAASGDARMKLEPGSGAAKTLNGNLKIRVANGRLGGINLMNELASVGKFAGVVGNAQPFTNLAALTGDVQVRDGVATSDNLLLEAEGCKLAAAGSVNLASEALDLKLTAMLGKEATQKAGGTRVGGYLTTALVNSQGELVIPALVTGTFAKPRFAPDAARFAEMKLKSVLPSAASALDMLRGKAAGTGTPAPPGAGPGTRSEPDVRGLLDAFKKIVPGKK